MRRLQKRADGNFHENFVKSLAILAEACYNRNKEKEKKESGITMEFLEKFGF